MSKRKNQLLWGGTLISWIDLIDWDIADESYRDLEDWLAQGFKRRDIPDSDWNAKPYSPLDADQLAVYRKLATFNATHKRLTDVTP